MSVKNVVVLYEINAPVYLDKLSRQQGREIGLGDIPQAEVGRLAALGADAVWLMGVWQRSPKAKAIGLADVGFQQSLRQTVPGYEEADFIGSAYAVRNYEVDARLGGNDGLLNFRTKLADCGVGLMLDFVPNHTAPDHPWLEQHPEYYIAGSAEDLARDPASFMDCGGSIFAKGRDPHLKAWSDVVQLNAFSDAYRQAAIEELKSIAQLCDGVRCDMAMLMLNDIFGQTWTGKTGSRPTQDFWQAVITAVRAEHPTFTFLAEAYWHTEPALLAQGFNYCYDKTFYDLLLKSDAGAVVEHLEETSHYQSNMAHFVENHDEARAAAAFGPQQARAAAALAATAPGLWLVHDGQMEGYKTRLPVHLGRGPREATKPKLARFYENLLAFVNTWKHQEASWQLLRTNHKNIIAWLWSAETAQYAVVVNYSSSNVKLRLDFIPNISRDTPGHELKPWQVLLLVSKNPEIK